MTLRDARPSYPEEAGAKRVRKKKEDRDREEGKRRLVIAIGCTGGAHRSVAIAEAIGQYLREKGLPTEIDHRDLTLEQARWTTPVEEA